MTTEYDDQVAVVLQRAYPGELSADELRDQTGLGTAELKSAIASLTQSGAIDADAEQYKWRDPDDQDAGGPPETPDTPDAEPEDEEPTTATSPPSPVGAVNRFTFSVDGGFPPARGQSDEAAAKQLGAIAEQVQNVLGTALPSLGLTVTIERLAIYDTPRVVIGGEDPTG